MLSNKDFGVTQVPGVQPASNEDSSADLGDKIGVTKVPKSNKSRIPGIKERPRFIIFDEEIMDGGRRYRAGVWYFYTRRARGKDAEDEPDDCWVCSPLYLDAVTTDSVDGNYGRLLRFKTTNGLTKTWAMPMALLKGDCSDVRGVLLSMGVEITTRHRSAFSAYLQEFTPPRRVQCTTQTGWAGPDHSAFVLPDTVIGPKAAQVVYQSELPLEQEYTRAGSLAAWQTGVSELASGNPVLALSLCTAFCGPVLSMCNMESGGIHLIGDSSSGKTSALLAACSVWGGPGFRRSWRATSNGLEGVAALFNDSLLALDEIGECDPRAVSEIVYMLGNGRGKQRATKLGTARNIARWRSSVLSTGERSVATTIEDGGYRIKAGQAVRILDIPVERADGVWDNLHHHHTGQQFSDELKRQSATHYGHAGRVFLNRLMRVPCHQLIARLETIKADLAPRYRNRGGQVERVISRFAVLALAGELATEFGVTHWQPGEAIQAAVVCFDAWRQMRGQELGNSEEKQIIDSLITFIERHGDSRFSDLKEEPTGYTQPTRDRAGYWSDVDGERTFMFTSSGMHEALRSFDFNRALSVLQSAKLIDPQDSQGKHSRLKRINGKQTRVYIVHPSRYFEADCHSASGQMKEEEAF